MKRLLALFASALKDIFRSLADGRARPPENRSGAITARLVKLGLIEDTATNRAGARAGGPHAVTAGRKNAHFPPPQHCGNCGKNCGKSGGGFRTIKQRQRTPATQAIRRVSAL